MHIQIRVNHILLSLSENECHSGCAITSLKIPTLTYRIHNQPGILMDKSMDENKNHLFCRLKLFHGSSDTYILEPTSQNSIKVPKVLEQRII